MPRGSQSGELVFSWGAHPTARGLRNPISPSAHGCAPAGPLSECDEVRRTMRAMAAAPENVDNPLLTEFCGMQLNSPIVLLSGCVGFGEEYTRVEGFSNRDVGAIVLKGTTGAPRLGNRPHRVYETPSGMLNAIGLQNPGAEHVVRKILPTLDFSETRFFANVSGSTIEEYAEVTRRFDDSPIDAIEINISCPNVKEGGVAFGNYPDMSAKVVEACRKATNKPIITKLSPTRRTSRKTPADASRPARMVSR